MAVDITPTQDGGVLKEILTAGSEEDGRPPKGCKVRAHYHGTLLDGTVFDSSVERNDPFEFTLGEGQVIKAWDLGVATMTKGEKARLTCQAKYAYGDSGSPPKIPGGATLIFDITLLSWQEEDLTANHDGGVLRAILENGEGYSHPAELCLCKVALKGTHEGRVFDEREISFTIGEGLDLDMPPGVEIALQKMKKGEKARITLSPKYGWLKGQPKFNIPADAKLKYELKLVEFEKDKESWDMDSCEKLAQATLLKEQATERFKAEKYKVAKLMYNKAATYIDKDQGFSESEDEERKKILLAVRLNLGLVHLKLSEHHDARLACDEALTIDPSNVKGLFRRGQAWLALCEPELAASDFEQVVRLEPNNSAAKTQIAVCKKKSAEIKAKERKIYSNMFDNFAKKDKEAYVYGWWDDKGMQPVVSELIDMPEEKDDLEERKLEKRRQFAQLKRIAEEKRKQREEEALAKAKLEGRDVDNNETVTTDVNDSTAKAKLEGTCDEKVEGGESKDVPVVLEGALTEESTTNVGTDGVNNDNPV